MIKNITGSDTPRLNGSLYQTLPCMTHDLCILLIIFMETLPFTYDSPKYVYTACAGLGENQ